MAAATRQLRKGRDGVALTIRRADGTCGAPTAQPDVEMSTPFVSQRAKRHARGSAGNSAGDEEGWTGKLPIGLATDPKILAAV